MHKYKKVKIEGFFVLIESGICKFNLGAFL